MTRLAGTRETPWLPRGSAAAVERRLTPEPERKIPRDPVEFAQEAGVHLWSKSREIARSVASNKETLVPACHASSKTFTAAEIAAWWIAGAPIGDRIVISTAPSDRQVKGLLWQEIAKAKYRHGLPGSISGAEWWIGPPGSRVLVGFGAKPQDLTNVEQAMQKFSGYHRTEGVLFLLDEATGIPPWLWVAGETVTTSDHDRILAIGNPDDPSSEFAKRCEASSGSTKAPGQAYRTRLANVIPIDAYATPNLTGEAVPQIVSKGLISKATVQRWREQWGEDNPLFVSKVRGLFPDRSSRNVIGPGLIRRAWQIDLPGVEQGAYGLDVSRSAHGDENALYRDRGGVIRLVDAWRNPDVTKTASHVIRHTSRSPAVPIVVDTDGIGGAVFDMLRNSLRLGLDPRGHGRRAIAFSVNMPPRLPRDFDSRRSEVWWSGREELDSGLWDLDEDDDELAAQLMAPRWSVDSRGRIHVETKDELAKRGIDSPDRADAVLMARFGAPRKAPPLNGNGSARVVRPAASVRTMAL